MGFRAGTRRMSLVGIPQLLAVVPAVVVLLVRWDRLPERMATRFGVDGSVNDHMSRSALLVTMVGLGLLLSVVFGLAARPAPGVRVARISRWDTARLLVALSWGLAGFLGVVLAAVVVSNVDARDTADVSMPVTALLYALGAAVVGGVVGTLIAPRSEAAAPEGAAPPVMDLRPEEHVSWSRSIGSPWFAVLGVVLLGAGAVLGWTVDPVAGVLVLVAGLLVSLSCRAMVTADRRGLTVTFSVLGWPRVRVGLDEIESAVEEENLTPAQFGGWGYRVVPGASGVVLRSGPALVVTRTSGRRFVVTVDDAETAARVLNGLRARRR